MKEDLAILFSGGADSVLLLKFAKLTKRNPIAVIIDYNQLHKEELIVAKEFLNSEKIKNIIIKLDNYNVNSGLTGNGEKGLYKDVNIMNVPARNTIFLSIAAGIAESENINEVWIGCDMSDYYGNFVDCYQSYIGKINELFKVSFSYPITVNAPLLGFSKDMVLKFLKSYNVDSKDIYSGYGGLENK